MRPRLRSLRHCHRAGGILPREPWVAVNETGRGCRAGVELKSPSYVVHSIGGDFVWDRRNLDQGVLVCEQEG